MNVQKAIKKDKKKKGPEVIDNRTPKPVDPEVSKVPVRSVTYMEVGTMEKARVLRLISDMNKEYEGMPGGFHYVIPVRDGKLGTDMEFEAEFLSTVNKMCEVKDGQIVLKGGATDCRVVRETI